MNQRKYIKNKLLIRSDANMYLIMQCIVSFFILIVINFIKQTDCYSDIGFELWIFARTTTIFLIMSFYKIKYNLSVAKSACILLLCFSCDTFIHILHYYDYPLLSTLIMLSFMTFVPFFMLSVYKYIYLKYIKLFIEKIPCKQKLYFKYIFILLVLFLLNIIIPLLISLLFMIVDLKAIFMIYIFYQVLLSKILPIITFIVAILLQKSIFYRNKVAPYLIYITLVGAIIDIIIYFNTGIIQLNGNPSIPVSFIATFLPMYIVFLLKNYKRHTTK